MNRGNRLASSSGVRWLATMRAGSRRGCAALKTWPTIGARTIARLAGGIDIRKPVNWLQLRGEAARALRPTAAATLGRPAELAPLWRPDERAARRPSHARALSSGIEAPSAQRAAGSLAPPAGRLHARRLSSQSSNFAGAELPEPPEPPPGSDESDLVQGSLVWNSAYDLICGEYGGQECRRLERDVALVRAAVAGWRLEERSEALEEALEEAEALRLELAEMDPAAPAREDGLTRDQMLANLQAFTAKATDELCTLMRDYLTVDAVCADLATYTQLMPDPESPTWLSIPEVLLSFISSTARVRAFLGRLRPLEPHEVAELGRRVRELGWPDPEGEPVPFASAEANAEIGYRVSQLFSHCVRKHQSGYAQSYCSSHFDHEEANAVSNMMSLVADTGDSRIERLQELPPWEHVVGYGRFLSVVEQEIRERGGLSAEECAAEEAQVPPDAVEAVSSAQAGLAGAVREVAGAAGAALYEGGRLGAEDYALAREPTGSSPAAQAARRGLGPVPPNSALEADREAVRGVLEALGPAYDGAIREAIEQRRFAIRSIETKEWCEADMEAGAGEGEGEAGGEAGAGAEGETGGNEEEPEAPPPAPQRWDLSTLFRTGVRVSMRTGTPYAVYVKLGGVRSPIDEGSLAHLFGRLYVEEERRRRGVVALRYDSKRWALEEYEYLLVERGGSDGFDLGPHDPFRVRGGAEALEGAIATFFELKAVRAALKHEDPGRRLAAALRSARRLVRLGLFLPALHDFQRAVLAIEGLNASDEVKEATARRMPSLLSASLANWYGGVLASLPEASPPVWAEALQAPERSARFSERFGLLAGAAMAELERGAGGPEAFAPRLAALAADAGARPAGASLAKALGPEGDPAGPAFWAHAAAGVERHCRALVAALASESA
eukprot:tig00000640_g2774.t1